MGQGDLCPDQKMQKKENPTKKLTAVLLASHLRGVVSGDWLAGEIEEGVVPGGTFGERDAPFWAYWGTGFLGPLSPE